MIINYDKLFGFNKTQLQFSTARQIYHLNVTICSFYKTEGLLSIQSYTILSIIEGPLRPAGGGLYCIVAFVLLQWRVLEAVSEASGLSWKFSHRTFF